MQNIFPFTDQLQVRLHDYPISPQSDVDPPTAAFQIVSVINDEFLLRCPRHSCLKLYAAYKYNGQLFEHPYRLRTVTSGVNIQNNTIVAGSDDISCYIRIFLDLKRLRYFSLDDFKRYLDVINDTVGRSPIPLDFHQFYLAIELSSNAQGIMERRLLLCNQGESLNLPMIASHPHNLTDTCIRERYQNEGRDGKIPCEFKLINVTPALNHFEMHISVISNTNPPHMDHRQLHWICKMLNGTNRKNASSTYSLHDKSGVIIAKVYGPNAQFSPDLIVSQDSKNYIRPANETVDFIPQLTSSQVSVRNFINVFRVSQTGYNRLNTLRQDPKMKRCLPFDGIASDQSENHLFNENKSAKLVEYKKKATKQLIVSDDNTKKTYSEKHVRLCVCVFNPQGVLIAEHICPPLRDLKEFPPLIIKSINLRKDQLNADDTPWIYSDVDFSKSMVNYPESPFELQFFFLMGVVKLSDEQLESYAGLPDLCVKTSYVTGCSHILQFTMPNRFEFSARRFYVRLSHTKSADHNDGPLFGDKTALIYFAVPESNASYIRSPNFDHFRAADIDQWVREMVDENGSETTTETFSLEYNNDLNQLGEMPSIISRRG